MAPHERCQNPKTESSIDSDDIARARRLKTLDKKARGLFSRHPELVDRIEDATREAENSGPETDR